MGAAKGMAMQLSRFVWASAALTVMGCQPTPPIVEMATPNVIAIGYEAYGSTPTLTPEALDKAIQHCKSQGGLYANYRGATTPNPLSTKEVHTFVCEKTKTDDGAVIAAQNEQYIAEAALTAAIWADAFEPQAPTQTQCTTVGFTTNCTSY